MTARLLRLAPYLLSYLLGYLLTCSDIMKFERNISHTRTLKGLNRAAIYFLAGWGQFRLASHGAPLEIRLAAAP